jgi:hypothetical protein
MRSVKVLSSIRYAAIRELHISANPVPLMALHNALAAIAIGIGQYNSVFMLCPLRTGLLCYKLSFRSKLEAKFETPALRVVSICFF